MESFRKKAVYWLPAVALMIAIFVFSAMDANESDDMSGPFVTLFVHVLELVTGRQVDLGSPVMGACVFVVRKSAHMTEYAMLAASFCFALGRTFSLRGVAMGAGALGLAVLYAATDEFHQTFVPGRAGMLTDIGIDAIGALAGICVFFLVCRIIRRCGNRKGKK